MELFKDFLHNDDVYVKAQAYWNKMCEEIFKLANQQNDWEPWFKLEYGNGTPMRDGNPITIWHNKKNKKTIRIIQTESSYIPICARMNIFDPDYANIPELIINCYLIETTSIKAKQLIDIWVSGQFNIEEMTNKIEEITQQRKLHG